MKTLDVVRFRNNIIRAQRKLNVLLSIDDRVKNMAIQGYIPKATNIKTLIRQYKKGVIFFVK